MFNSDKAKNAMTIATGVAEGASVILQAAEVAEGMFQSLSLKECQALDQLKRDYEQHLKKPYPAWMGYDAKSKLPICSYNYTYDQRATLVATSFFSSESLELQHDAISIIDRRQPTVLAQQRYKIDVTHQLFTELRDFAERELPHLTLDADGISVLERRITYLNAVQSYAALEPGVTSKAEYARQPILLKMKRTLQLAKGRAEEEAAQRSARQKLDDLVSLTGSIRTNVLHSIYHLKTPPQFTFDTTEYRLPTLRITQIEKEEEIPESLTVWQMDKTLVTLIQNRDYEPLQRETLQEAIKGLHPYFQSLVTQHLKNVEHQIPFLELLNNLYKELSSYKELIETLRLARLLAGVCGDDWCYGQKEGQRLMQGLLEVLRASHERLQTHVKKLTLLIRDLDEDSIKALSGVKTSTVEGRSFHQLQQHLSEAEEFLKKRQKVLDGIEQDLKNWPSDAAKRTQQQIEQLGVQVNALRVRYQLTPLDVTRKTETAATVVTARVTALSSANSVTVTSTITPKVLSKAKTLKPISSFPQISQIAAPLRKSINIAPKTMSTGVTITVPACLSDKVESEPSFFHGKNLRHKFFLDPQCQGLFTSLNKNLKDIDTHRDNLNVDPFTALDALQDLIVAKESMFVVLNNELTRIQTARSTLRFYHDTSRLFLETWEALIDERKKLLQEELKYFLNCIDVAIQKFADISTLSPEHPSYADACDKASRAQAWLSTRNATRETDAMLPDKFILHCVNEYQKNISTTFPVASVRAGQSSSSVVTVLQMIPPAQNFALDPAKEAAIDTKVAKVHETDKEVKAMLAEAKRLTVEARAAAVPKSDITTTTSQSHTQETQLKP